MRAGWYAALATCTPSYFTSEGMKTAPPASMEEAMANARKAGWGTGILDYQRIVEDYIARTDNKLEGFLISEASV
jgi:hypothetical protein